MKKMGTIVLAGLLAISAGAVEFDLLSVPEMAQYGATHCLVVKWTDFTCATSNTVQSFTNTIPAKTSLECVGMILDTPFDWQTTNYTSECKLTVGDGTVPGADMFISSTELASDGTEVFVKYPPGPFTLLTLTNNLAMKTGQIVQVKTGTVNYVSTSESQIRYQRKLYASAGSMVATFTPDSSEKLSLCKQGKVRVFFKVLRFGGGGN